MKKAFLYFGLFFVLVAGMPKKTLRSLENKAFDKGETLNYRVHYGFVDAGEATLEVLEDDVKIGGRSTLHVVGRGTSVGPFDWFFKVRDRYESYLDEEAILPWVFVRRVNEGGYHLERDVVFNHFQNQASINKDKYDTPEGCQDVLSAYYFARTQDLQNMEVGEMLEINTFFDKEVYPLAIKYMGKKVIDTKIGKIRCLEFMPMLQEGRVFTDEEDMRVWISDDNCKIPVRVQADILVGSIRMDIKSVKGLTGELAFVDE